MQLCLAGLRDVDRLVVSDIKVPSWSNYLSVANVLVSPSLPSLPSPWLEPPVRKIFFLVCNHFWIEAPLSLSSRASLNIMQL